MALLQIRKLSTKVWEHIADIGGSYVLTKFMAKKEFNKFFIVEVYGSKRFEYSINEIEVYDIGGVAETFTNFDDLFLRLEVLKYTGFYIDGEFTFNPSSYDLSEFQNTEVDRFAKLSDITAGGIPEAPIDGQLYGRQSAAWSLIPTVGAGTKTFNLNIPKVTITRSATPLYYAQGLSGSVLLNNSTGLSDGSVLNSIGGITTTLFCIPYDCKLQVVIMHTNALDFDLSIWKSDDFSNPTTNSVRIFQANTTTGIIENYAVASIDLQQGNLIQPFVKINTGSGGTNLGEIFLTFESI